jgi:hypothetical protein
MELTEIQFGIRKENGETIPRQNVVFVAGEPFAGWPRCTGKLRDTDANEKEKQAVITEALLKFSFLIPSNTLFRLCYLGEKIRNYTSDEKAKFISDLLLLNGHCYSILHKVHPHKIVQI